MKGLSVPLTDSLSEIHCVTIEEKRSEWQKIAMVTCVVYKVKRIYKLTRTEMNLETFRGLTTKHEV